jgi:hypothetical protein
MPAELRALKAELKQTTDVTQQRRLQVRLSKVQQAIKKNEDLELAEQVCARAYSPAMSSSRRGAIDLIFF